MISESSKQFGGVRNVRMLYTAGHITELCILCKGQLLGRGPVQHSLNIYITVSLISVSDSLSLATQEIIRCEVLADGFMREWEHMIESLMYKLYLSMIPSANI